MDNKHKGREAGIARLFAVNESPFAVLNYNESDYRAFIESFQAHYFARNADLIVSGLSKEDIEEEQKQLIATHLRIIYAQALETLFALTFAILQAPNCIQGWLIKYTSRDLHDLTQKVFSKKSFPTRPKLTNYDWKDVVYALYNNKPRDDLDTIVEWYIHFANEFNNTILQVEYNSIKHGFRTISKASQMRLDTNDSIGTALIMNSDFGTTIGVLSTVTNNNKTNLVFDYHRVNWTVEDTINNINALTLLIHNNIAHLSTRLGFESQSSYFVPKSASVSETIKGTQLSPSFVSRSTQIIIDAEELFTRDQILKSYT
jgi:hypothetical protein